MEWGQRFRRLMRGGKDAAQTDDGPIVETLNPADASAPARQDGRGGLITWSVIAVVLLLALYYPLGAILDHQINDNTSFAPAPGEDARSESVAVVTALLTREIDTTGWVANTPPIAPNALLKYGGNMMNFQIGITTAIGVFSVEMRDRLGRARGLSEEDPDLKQAASDIQYDAERWIWRWGRILPEASAEDQYRSARDALARYNERLGAGEAVFDPRADNLLSVLDRVAFDLGAASERLQARVGARDYFLLDREADKIYYNVKGRAYAYLLILRALRLDFADVIEARAGVAEPYDEMLEALELVASAKPLVVMNGATTGLAANNHLASQGFLLLRARTKMREITDILAK